MPKFADTRYGMEIRPIIGWRKGDYEFIVNPIIDLSFGRNGEAVFAPNARFARNFGEDFALAVEYYTDLGPFTHFLPLKEQSHAIYGVTDFKIGRFDIEAGIGYGLTKPGSDRLVTKLMVTTNLFNSKEDESKSNVSSKAALPTKAPKKSSAAEVPYNYSGCFAGGYGGGTWAADIHTFDPSSAGGAIPVRNVLQHALRQPANGGAYRIPFKESPTAGGTLGCNWQVAQSAWVWGAEGESGFMRLRGRAVDPFSADFNNDTIDTTTIGNWYGSVAGRFGFAYERAWFYGKAGVGFTSVKSTVADGCSAVPCGTGLLSAAANNSAMRAFPVAGGGIEWAWTGNWTLKFEYLFLGLTENYAVCGLGGGTAAGSNFCSSHSLDGIHTTKLGLNYKLF